MEWCLNTRKLINAMNHTKTVKKKKIMIILVETEKKAFDKIHNYSC